MDVNKEVIFLTVVGNRDPQWSEKKQVVNPLTGEKELIHQNVDGPVFTFLNNVYASAGLAYLKPDKAYYLYTRHKKPEDEEDIAHRTREVISQGLTRYNIQGEHVCLEITDPRHFRSLLREMGKVAKQVRAAHPSAHIVILTSPGTPQMTATWFVLGNEGRLPNTTFLQQAEPRFGNKISEVDFEPLFEVEQMRTAVHLMRQGRFYAAADQFENLSSVSYDRSRRDAARIAQSFCEIWGHWDRFAYNDALSAINVAVKYPPLQNHPLQLRLNEYTNVLEKVVANEHMPTVLNWLWAAGRALSAERHLDCVWRCQTTYEVMLRLKLRLEGLPYWNEGTVQQLEHRLTAGTTIDIFGYKHGREVLTAPPLYPPSASLTALLESKVTHNNRRRTLKNILREMGSLRNGLVHEGTLCTQQEAAEMFGAIAYVVSKFFSVNKAIITTFPFSLPSLQAITNDIEALLDQGNRRASGDS